jgi:hypothetical protein
MNASLQMTPCSLIVTNVTGNPCYSVTIKHGLHCLPYQIWKRQVPPKRRYLPTEPHDLALLTLTLIFTTVRTKVLVNLDCVFEQKQTKLLHEMEHY